MSKRINSQGDLRDRESPPLDLDKDLNFPHFILIKASAGTGKTHALTLRFIQFLLSPLIPQKTNADLRNILAITFTRNAAKEMKFRVLDWLKKCYFGDSPSLQQVAQVVSLSIKDIRKKAALVIEEILNRYSDFQVETIDSFMATIFRASAIDLGYQPDFEIVFDASPYLEYAFSRFIRPVTEKTREAQLLRQVLDDISSMTPETSSYLWDPSAALIRNLRDLYSKLEAFNRQPISTDFKSAIEELQLKIKKEAFSLEKLINQSGCERNLRSSFYSSILPGVEKGYFNRLGKASFKTPPIKERGRREEELILSKWKQLVELICEWAKLYAFSFFQPHILVYRQVIKILDSLKREQGVIFIEDLNKAIANYITQGIVPDIYFRLGEKIYHFLIDEFQDTSPLQWHNLRPLIANSLAEQGSLFIVGDTKQAIYGFREADYRIMKRLEEGEDPFPSASVMVRTLKRNFRSKEEVLDFVGKVFPLDRQRRPQELRKVPPEYFDLAAASGLDNFEFEPARGGEGEKAGYVGLEIIEEPKEKKKKEASRNDNRQFPPQEGGVSREERQEGRKSPSTLFNEEQPEKSRLLSLLRHLLDRGYEPSEIAILTYRNETVKQVSSWLNEEKLDFIPFSSLDIRLRPCVREIFAFLRFLDFPPDNLNFATFILGEVLARKLTRDGYPHLSEEFLTFVHQVRGGRNFPLYSRFRSAYPQIWKGYFETAYRQVGYSPLYDLVGETFRLFEVFETFPEEEASWVKLLEVINEFEGQGKNNLREFLEFTQTSDDTNQSWSIDVSEEVNAIRVMSIHKAKGLGFPVVILLLYPEKFLPSPFYIFPPGFDEKDCYVLRLNKELVEKDLRLKAVYEEHRLKDSVGRLNTLYVALTRAKKELYLLGVKKKRGGKYPFDLLESISDLSAGPLIDHQQSKIDKRPARPLRGDLPLLRWPAPPRLRPKQKVEYHPSAFRRGQFLHEVLAQIKWVDDDYPQVIKRALAGLGRQEEKLTKEEKEVLEKIPSYLELPPLRDLFLPHSERQVWRETEVCDEQGQLFRLDRVVVDKEVITVIDFKSGRKPPSLSEFEKDIKRQMEKYLSLLRQIFPRKQVQGLVAYFDSGEWEVYK